MPDEENKAFQDTLCYAFERVMNALVCVDVSKAEAREPDDQAAILDQVKSTIGVEKLNSLVTEALRVWVLRAARKAVGADGDDLASVVVDDASAQLFNGIAMVLREQVRMVVKIVELLLTDCCVMFRES